MWVGGSRRKPSQRGFSILLVLVLTVVMILASIAALNSIDASKSQQANTRAARQLAWVSDSGAQQRYGTVAAGITNPRELLATASNWARWRPEEPTWQQTDYDWHVILEGQAIAGEQLDAGNQEIIWAFRTFATHTRRPIVSEQITSIGIRTRSLHGNSYNAD